MDLQLKHNIQDIWELQQNYVAPKTAADRKAKLKQLRTAILAHEQDIKEALYKDLHKCSTEAFIAEIYPLLSEIQLFQSNLNAWLRPKKVANNLVFTGSDAKLLLEPKGKCLIISPWNYPFQLSLLHLIACVAAGNTAIIKPSEFTPHASAVLKTIIEEVFEPGHVAVVEGDVDVSTFLLSLPFDHIHFTGSTKVGKVVMTAAAQHLSSCTLELGGKSPVVIDDKINLKYIAKKIVFGKFINLGQTCIAPDYVLVPTNRKDDFVQAMKEAMDNAFGEDVQQNKDLGRMVNIGHHQRVVDLLKQAREQAAIVVHGGEYDVSDLYIDPTLVVDVPLESDLMQEEIFGPLLPIVTFDKVADAIAIIKARPKPLAFYLFTHQAKWVDYFIENTSSGALVINEIMVHILHPNLPFGGVNHSGHGQSTGYFGLKDFSHEKPILKANSIVSPTKMMGFPYDEKLENWLKILV